MPRERLPASLHPTLTPQPQPRTPRCCAAGTAPCGTCCWHRRARAPRVAEPLCAGVFAFRAQLGGLPLPPAHGYSCRQRPITMASALPAGTACPFPSLCSQEAAREPWAASLGPRPPRHLLGGFTMGLPPPPQKPQLHRGRPGWCWVSRVGAARCQPSGANPALAVAPGAPWGGDRDRTPGGGHIPQRKQHSSQGHSSPLPTAEEPCPCTAL